MLKNLPEEGKTLIQEIRLGATDYSVHSEETKIGCDLQLLNKVILSPCTLLYATLLLMLSNLVLLLNLLYNPLY